MEEKGVGADRVHGVSIGVKEYKFRGWVYKFWGKGVRVKGVDDGVEGVIPSNIFLFFADLEAHIKTFVSCPMFSLARLRANISPGIIKMAKVGCGNLPSSGTLYKWQR